MDAPPPEKPRKKRKKRAADVAIVMPPPSPRFRTFFIVLASVYLATVWLDGVGSNWPSKVTPRPWLYFSQIAALFVNAAPKVIDYRAEGWSCNEHRWVEVDTRPYFRIDEDNKENRFQRALQFYRKNRVVMRSLEDYVVKRYNATNAAPIGGVRFSSLRLSYPAPGEHVAPFQHLPITTYSGEQRHDWYWTTKSRRAERCGQRPDPADGTDDAREPGGKDNEPKETDP